MANCAATQSFVRTVPLSVYQRSGNEAFEVRVLFTLVSFWSVDIGTSRKVIFQLTPLIRFRRALLDIINSIPSLRPPKSLEKALHSNNGPFLDRLFHICRSDASVSQVRNSRCLRFFIPTTTKYAITSLLPLNILLAVYC